MELQSIFQTGRVFICRLRGGETATSPGNTAQPFINFSAPNQSPNLQLLLTRGSRSLQNPIPEVPLALRYQLGLVQAEPCVHCSTRDWGQDLSCAQTQRDSRGG